jgi:hypothetical protein
MSGYKNFAIVGAGLTGSFIVRQFLMEKAAGTVNQVVVLTRQVSFVVVTGFPIRAYPTTAGLQHDY